MAGAIARRNIFKVLGPGTHGSTWGGHPLGMQLALRTLDVYKQENLGLKMESLGNSLMQYFNELKSQNSDIIRVEGLGAMIGLELKDSASANYYKKKLFKAGDRLGLGITADMIEEHPNFYMPKYEGTAIKGIAFKLADNTLRINLPAMEGHTLQAIKKMFDVSFLD